MLYLGPIRDKPPLNYRPPLSLDHGRWASGMAAWDALANGTDGFVSKVNRWMSDPKLMDTGYGVERRKFKVVDQEQYVESAFIGQVLTLDDLEF